MGIIRQLYQDISPGIRHKSCAKQSWQIPCTYKLYEPMEKPEQMYEFAELQDNALLHFTEQGKEYWVYLENMTCFTRKPIFVTIGFMEFLMIGTLYMRRGGNNGEVYRRSDIKCTITYAS